jgi:hypothetical protein
MAHGPQRSTPSALRAEQRKTTTAGVELNLLSSLLNMDQAAEESKEVFKLSILDDTKLEDAVGSSPGSSK